MPNYYDQKQNGIFESKLMKPIKGGELDYVYGYQQLLDHFNSHIKDLPRILVEGNPDWKDMECVDGKFTFKTYANGKTVIIQLPLPQKEEVKEKSHCPVCKGVGSVCYFDISPECWRQCKVCNGTGIKKEEVSTEQPEPIEQGKKILVAPTTHFTNKEVNLHKNEELGSIVKEEVKGEEELYRWVKASERLGQFEDSEIPDWKFFTPDFCRVDGKPAARPFFRKDTTKKTITFSYIYTGEFSKEIHEKLFDKIEWLEPITKGKEDKEAVEEADWKEECERLEKIIGFWRDKYYEVCPPAENHKVDNF